MNNLYALKFTITNFCWYKCKYCYVDTSNKDIIDKVLAFRLIDYYFSQIWKNKIIFFLWWEALLEFELLQQLIIYSIKKSKEFKKDITFFLTTSWLSINNYKIVFLYNHNVKIWLSIDWNKYIHWLNRVSLNWNNTYHNTIKALHLLNNYYKDNDMWYALTVDENTVKYLFKSFLFLSNLDKNKRNITIAWVYKQNWDIINIKTLDSELKKICDFIFISIKSDKFYYYNVLSFFILESIKWNVLKQWNIEIHCFPDGEISLHLFSQSILWNINDDPTKWRFDYVNKTAFNIIKKWKEDSIYIKYIDSLKNKAIL